MEEQLGKAIEEATPVGFEAGRSFERNRILGVVERMKRNPRDETFQSKMIMMEIHFWNAALAKLKEEITK